MGLANIVLEQGRKIIIAHHIHQDGMVGNFIVVDFRHVIIVVLA